MISLDLVVCVYIGGVDWFVPRCAGVKCGDTLRLGTGAFLGELRGRGISWM